MANIILLIFFVAAVAARGRLSKQFNKKSSEQRPVLLGAAAPDRECQDHNPNCTEIYNDTSPYPCMCHGSQSAPFLASTTIVATGEEWTPSQEQFTLGIGECGTILAKYDTSSVSCPGEFNLKVKITNEDDDKGNRWLKKVCALSTSCECGELFDRVNDKQREATPFNTTALYDPLTIAMVACSCDCNGVQKGATFSVSLKPICVSVNPPAPAPAPP